MRISGQIAAGSDPAVRAGEVKNPAAFARTTFIEALERAGVEVSATPLAPTLQTSCPPEVPTARATVSPSMSRGR
jgi:D-alanyl-D-alanine carboxypeptidase/D-alanyl-D-alanine-endopeptidase (penicillin-binding protein 4)